MSEINYAQVNMNLSETCSIEEKQHGVLHTGSIEHSEWTELINNGFPNW